MKVPANGADEGSNHEPVKSGVPPKKSIRANEASLLHTVLTPSSPAFTTGFTVIVKKDESFSQTPVFDQSISIDQTFTTSTEIFPFTNQQINGAGINGTVTLNSDTSLIRIILKDSLTVEYMVFESHPLLDTTWNFSFSDECEETCFMDGFTPTSILFYLRDATVYIDDFVWCSSPVADPINLQMSSKQNKVSSKLDKIKSYIEKEHLIWKADFTNHSDLFYYEKLLNNI